MTDSAPTPFLYPDAPHTRKHGPTGYRNYKSYKPWLRDEFVFRCVFCLSREVWYPNGQDAFHVEHLKPRKLSPELEVDYDNLVYSCGSCNSFKQDKWPILSPFQNAYGVHFVVNGDGTIEGLTHAGRRTIKFLRLDRDELNLFRLNKIRKILTLWEWRHVSDIAVDLRNELRYPTSLPRLNSRQENRRRAGMVDSHHAKNLRGELLETY